MSPILAYATMDETIPSHGADVPVCNARFRASASTGMLLYMMAAVLGFLWISWLSEE